MCVSTGVLKIGGSSKCTSGHGHGRGPTLGGGGQEKIRAVQVMHFERVAIFRTWSKDRKSGRGGLDLGPADSGPACLSACQGPSSFDQGPKKLDPRGRQKKVRGAVRGGTVGKVMPVLLGGRPDHDGSGRIFWTLVQIEALKKIGPSSKDKMTAAHAPIFGLGSPSLLSLSGRPWAP